MAFEFRGQTFVLTVDFDEPLADLKAAVAAALPEAIPPGEIEFLFGGSHLDPEMTISDLEPNPDDVIHVTTKTIPPPPKPALAAAAPTLTVYVMLLIGAIPRRSRFVLPPDATADRLLAEANAKWELDGIDVELVLGDPSQENWETVNGDTPVAGFDFTVNEFAVREKVEQEPQQQRQADADVDLTNTLTFGSVRAATQPPPAGKPYRFSIPQRGLDEKIFYFMDGVPLSAVKVKIAQEFQFPGPEYVTLLFLGKQLKDTFKIERLRLGDKPIIVSLRDVSEILLLTARAFRTGGRG
jgi:hypothetical protein